LLSSRDDELPLPGKKLRFSSLLRVHWSSPTFVKRSTGAISRWRRLVSIGAYVESKPAEGACGGNASDIVSSLSVPMPLIKSSEKQSFLHGNKNEDSVSREASRLNASHAILHGNMNENEHKMEEEKMKEGGNASLVTHSFKMIKGAFIFYFFVQLNNSILRIIKSTMG